ncbi:MAG TPA: hypothetical protein VFE58_04285 [Tepidisphaeraceae bacterium]|jgi:hypothetical protein|nr:hypothetical protein [Tepidisphaeraceae bacterium]
MRNLIKKCALCASLALLLILQSTHATGIDPQYIPSDAKWLIHVDMDALIKTKLWNFVNVNINAFTSHRGLSIGVGPTSQPSDGPASRKIKALADALGMKLPEDIHGLTLVGRSFDEADAFLLVKATMDHDRIIGLAKINPQYTSTTHAGVEISSWKGEDISGAFLSEDILALAQRSGGIEQAIDAAHSPQHAPSGLLAGVETKPGDDNAGVVIYIAAEGLAELQKEEELSPILTPVTRVRASFAERGDDLVLTAVLDVKTAESARQVRGALEGIRALASLAVLEGNDQTAKALAMLAQRATSSVQDTTVTVHWPFSLSVVQQLAADQFGKKPKHSAKLATTHPEKK